MAITEEQGRYIEQIFKKMYKGLHSYALSVLRNEFQAEEAVQETFYTVCKKPEEFLASPNPPGWVKTVLVNVLKNTLRRNATLRKYFVAAGDAGMERVGDPRLQADGSVDLMYGDLIHKEGFYLLKQIILENRTFLDMAEELDISVDACKKRFYRAEEKFRKEIEKIGEI